MGGGGAEGGVAPGCNFVAVHSSPQFAGRGKIVGLCSVCTNDW